MLLNWPHQVRGVAEVTAGLLAGEQRICLTSPTGGGKSRMICQLIEWAIDSGWYSVLYTNRKLLIEQLAGVVEQHGIRFGVRASGHEDNRERPVQISSLPTERARVLKTQKWEAHGQGQKVLALVDECHMNSSDTAQQMLDKHVQDGGAVVGFTATPIGLGHLYTKLIVAGTPSELRRCGALVPAYHYGPDEPDMRKFKQNVKTGEYSEGQIRKAIMTKCIFGRVWEWWQKLNHEQRPTLLFGPGVAESIWFAERFHERGIRSAHIDGKGIWLDGEYRQTGTEERQHILDSVRRGEIMVLCNRFVLREGLDLPEVSHLILATVMGSLQTYLQSCGRGLRKAEGKDRLTLQDHGGHWWRHGSVNMDRRWSLDQTENLIGGMRTERLREKKEAEPIRCAQCGMVRAGGPKCPHCGFESQKRSRMVMQMDGSLREHTGDIYRPRRVAMKPNTQKLWETMYWRSRQAKRTFRAAEALFFVENHYYPPRDLPMMPTHERDWFRTVDAVPPERLTS